MSNRWKSAVACVFGAMLGGTVWAAGAAAQTWPRWAEDAFGLQTRRAPSRSYSYRPFDPSSDWPPPVRREPPPAWDRQQGQQLMEGGPRPEIVAAAPPVIPFTASFEANSIVIDTAGRKLYYVLAERRAYAYDISVGREGFSWTGSETVSRKQEWPDWHPPAEMRERDPRLPVKMTGGIRNPLGAMALYLGTTLYRIHGTNDEKSIGRAESSGCFRMMNASVLHLASITEIGTKVTVVAGIGGQVETAAAPPVARPGERSRPDERWRDEVRTRAEQGRWRQEDRWRDDGRSRFEWPRRPPPPWGAPPPPWGWGYSYR